MWPIWVGMMDAIAITTMVVMMMILIPSSHSLVFDLPSGRTKCISEDLRINAVAVGHFKIALKPPHNYLISSRVTDSNGDSIYYADSVESGEFAFTAAESGQYTICFWSPRYELSTSFPFEFEWKIGLAAKDWTVYVKKEKVDRSRQRASGHLPGKCLSYICKIRDTNEQPTRVQDPSH
ncbi:transmembrane emp24 domain-containing protein p24delta10-like isoform X3 [Magnolia sinica]|uniref:transmembrane emp24 domain-containing protein p24delta10-like isoform X3 n=1 Tax=Magnolia sinica TaxID=86752 RepID=UPI0026582AD7|nr:transmembrane emp24 domain-containing protein p24delta10-like isoform X3 [Magnolia sinica]